MEVLIIILNKEEYLEKILSLIIEAGASGATILDSEGLGHFLAYEVPIFAGLRHLVGEKKSRNRTILAILENENIFPEIEKLFAEENIDFSQPGVGIIVTIPVNKVIKPPRELL